MMRSLKDYWHGCLSPDDECPSVITHNAEHGDKLMTGQLTPIHLETSQNWLPEPSATTWIIIGTTTINRAVRIEKARSDSISTLTVAEDIAQKLVTWIED